MTATEIPLGQSGTIIKLHITGSDRRRLMDLGFGPGAVIERVLDAPLGATIAFRIRGTVIALRDEQTDLIEVTPCKN